MIRSWLLPLLLIALAPAPAGASDAAAGSPTGTDHLLQVDLAAQEPLRAPGAIELLRGLEREVRTRIVGPDALLVSSDLGHVRIAGFGGHGAAPATDPAVPRTCERLPYHSTAPPRI